MTTVSVILPAAGAATRFGAEENKIFQPLAGRAVFLRTLDAFASRDDVRDVQLVISPADAAEMRRRHGSALDAMNVRLTLGGQTRSESVRNALARVSDAAELVCIHDAVRPCIATAWIDAVFAAAAECGAAILAYPVHGTLKKVGPGDVIDRTVSRAGLWEAQTPQVFRREWLRQAYEQAGSATDDAALVEALGHKVRVVMGDPRNIKITTPADLRLAAAVIDSVVGRP